MKFGSVVRACWRRRAALTCFEGAVYSEPLQRLALSD